MNKEGWFHYFYKWISYFQNAHICEGEHIICFCNEKNHAHVIFHQQLQTIELSITDKKTKKNIFYLHFEVNDILVCKNNILTFFQYLKGQEKQVEDQQLEYFPPIKILVCCTSGLSSSYFAALTQAAFENQKESVQVDACPISELTVCQQYYDMVLLAPQVAYRYHELKQKWGDKIMRIDTMDFATGNVKHALKNIMV